MSSLYIRLVSYLIMVRHARIALMFIVLFCKTHNNICFKMGEQIKSCVKIKIHVHHSTVNIMKVSLSVFKYNKICFIVNITLEFIFE